MPKRWKPKPKLRARQVTQIRIDDIIIDPSLNVRARVFTPDDKLVESIRELGVVNPIIVTDQYKLAAGFARVEAAKILGMKTINALCCGSISDQEIITINLHQNSYRVG